LVYVTALQKKGAGASLETPARMLQTVVRDQK
jgi:hypothetical protein